MVSLADSLNHRLQLLQASGLPRTGIMSDSNLLIVCVPSLVATLLNRERTKGSPLTEQEVLEIRDKASAIAMPDYALAEVEAGRGYKDIDPENAWEEWQKARLNYPELK